MDLEKFLARGHTNEADALEWLEAQYHDAVRRKDKRCLDLITFTMQCVTYSGTMASSLFSLREFLSSPETGSSQLAIQVKSFLPNDSAVIEHRKHRRKR